jgi:hypothetical protein
MLQEEIFDLQRFDGDLIHIDGWHFGVGNKWKEQGYGGFLWLSSPSVEQQTTEDAKLIHSSSFPPQFGNKTDPIGLPRRSLRNEIGENPHECVGKFHPFAPWLEACYHEGIWSGISAMYLRNTGSISYGNASWIALATIRTIISISSSLQLYAGAKIMASPNVPSATPPDTYT